MSLYRYIQILNNVGSIGHLHRQTHARMNARSHACMLRTHKRIHTISGIRTDGGGRPEDIPPTITIQFSSLIKSLFGLITTQITSSFYNIIH